jgi:hypothetical protein
LRVNATAMAKTSTAAITAKVSHHQRLAFHGITERDDHLLMHRRRIRYAMGHEEVGHL